MCYGTFFKSLLSALNIGANKDFKKSNYEVFNTNYEIFNTLFFLNYEIFNTSYEFNFSNSYFIHIFA